MIAPTTATDDATSASARLSHHRVIVATAVVVALVSAALSLAGMPSAAMAVSLVAPLALLGSWYRGETLRRQAVDAEILLRLRESSASFDLLAEQIRESAEHARIASPCPVSPAAATVLAHQEIVTRRIGAEAAK